MNSTAKPAQDRFADTVDGMRQRFIELLRAIHDGSYFDAWLSATLFRSALDFTTELARELPPESRWRSGYILDAMRCAAAPVLALAPSPDRYEVRTLRDSNPDAEQRAWKLVEDRWRQEIRCACLDNNGADVARLN
jgi:hypothetical protein